MLHFGGLETVVKVCDAGRSLLSVGNAFLIANVLEVIDTSLVLLQIELLLYVAGHVASPGDGVERATATRLNIRSILAVLV